MRHDEKDNRGGDKKDSKPDTTSNVHISCRIKPGDRESTFIKKVNANKISIRDHRTDKEQQFSYDKIFDAGNDNDVVFNYVYEKGIMKLFDNSSCCFLAVGQKSSGKSHTLFGVDSRMGSVDGGLGIMGGQDVNGIIVKTFESLVKSASELQDTKDFQIFCSFVEIHKETVRDLLAKHFLNRDGGDIGSHDHKSSYDGSRIDGDGIKSGLEGLDVFENSNGVIMLKNLSQVAVADLDE
jgi:hypothetical protein